VVSADSLLVKALRRKPTPRPPIWLMRQAGRYLPEFRALREKVPFLTACRTPDVAAELTLQPIRRFGLDAAILFSDILIPLEAMGLEVSFGEAGPRIENPVRNAAAVSALRVPEPAEAMPFVAAALYTVRGELPPATALLGFAGGPWTLFCYAVEGAGGSDTGFETAKRFALREPKAAHALLDKLAQTVSRHLAAQVRAGADAVQIFDTWAGELSPGDFEELALPYLRKVVEGVRQEHAPVIAFGLNTGGYLELLSTCGADCIGVDWRVDIAEARRRLRGLSVQGNLDPMALYAPPAEVKRRAVALIRAAGSEPGHVFNLGHGMRKDLPLESVQALVDAVQSFRW
jgi:uroporphyrinogen decarboxylase